MILDKEKLLNEGYLSFNIKDIDINLYNDILNQKKDINKISDIWILRYETSFITETPNELKQNLEDICFKFQIPFNLSGDIENFTIVPQTNLKQYPTRLRLTGKLENLKKIQETLDLLNQNANQTWYYKSNIVPFEQNTIFELYNKIITYGLYENDIINKNLYETAGDLAHGCNLTLYLKNNFIESHIDGLDPNRLCAFLIYLNDDYEEGFGGEIKLEDNKIIPPIFGNIVILDFTKNNKKHEVLPVTNESFKRYALIKFFYK